MANKNDERIRFVAEVEGTDKVKATGEAFDVVGKAAEAADPKAAALMDQLDRATRLDKAVSSFAGLSAQLQETGDKLFLAQRRAAALEEEFNNTLTPTKKLETDLAKARIEVGRLTDAQGRQTAELKRAENVIRGAGISLDKLAQSQGVVRAAAAQSVAAVRSYGAELSKTSEKAAASTGIFQRLRGAIAGVFAGLTLRGAAEGVKDIALLGDQAERTRNQFTQMYGSVAAGNAALAELNKFAAANGLALDATQKSAAKLKNFGLDPLAGSLRALVNQNAAAGGSMEDLDGKILAVGQAWAKQKLQGEEILQLVERGVPVWEALVRSTGKSVAELQKLSEAGKLGRKEISGLLAEIDKMNTGAAARNAGTLSGQFQQLTGRIREFFTQVANSGTLDYLKGQLVALNKYIADMAASGQLARLAQSISDGIVGTGQAIAGVVGFVKDYGEQILLLARAYLVFKGASVVTGVLSGITKGFGDAAAGAAGATSAAGKFGASLRGLVKGPLMFAAIAAAADFTLGQLEKLVSVTQEYFDVQEKLRQQQEELKAQREALQAQARATAAAFKGAGDIQIQTAEAVGRMTRTQIQAYIVGLQNASRELGALRVKANEIGDAQGAAKLTARLRELVVAVGEANAALSTVNSAGGGGVGEFARKIAADLEVAIAAGKSAAAALAGIFDQVDLGTPKGVQDVVDTLLVVGPRARDARAALESELGAALEKLSGEQLRLFQLRAEKAFQAAGGGAKELALLMNSALAVAMARLGVDAGKMGFAFTESGRDMIATFKAVTENAQATSQQITTAFNAALEKATTKAEAEALGAAIKAAGEQGKVGIDQAKDAATALSLRLREIAAQADPLADQFARFGIKTQAELALARDSAERFYLAVVDGARKGKYAQEDVKAAFLAYAEAARAAVANSTAAARQQVEAQLRAKAAALGLRDALGDVGAAGQQAGTDVEAGADRAAAALGGLEKAADDAAGSASKLGDSADGAADGLDKVSRAGAQATEITLSMSKAFADAATNAHGLDRITFTVGAEQQRQAQELLESLQQQNLQYDEMAQRVAALRQQFNYLGDEQLQQIAREQQQLEQNRQRKQQELEDQRQKQREQQASGSGGAGGVTRVEIVHRIEGDGKVTQQQIEDAFRSSGLRQIVTTAVVEQLQRSRVLAGG